MRSVRKQRKKQKKLKTNSLVVSVSAGSKSKKPKKRENLDTEILFKAIKPHLCEHMTENFTHFGAIVLTSDTQRSESELKYVCKQLFDQTNRTYKNLQHQMMSAYVKNLRASELKKSFERKRAAPLLSDVGAVSDGEAVVRVSFANYGNIKISQLHTTKIWKRADGKNDAVESIHQSLISFEHVVNLIRLNQSITTDSFSRIKSIMESKKPHLTCSIKFYKGIVISNAHHRSDDNSQPIPFTIHCNNRYNMSKTGNNGPTCSVFSYIEVLSAGGQRIYYQVAAAIQICTTTNTEYLLVIKLRRSSRQSPLPFELYGYDIKKDSNTLCYDLLLIDHAYRPCITFRYDERPNTTPHLQLFFIIPYDRIGKIPNPAWGGCQNRVDIYKEDARQDVKSSRFPLFTTTEQQFEALEMMKRAFSSNADVDAGTANVGEKRKSMDA